MAELDGISYFPGMDSINVDIDMLDFAFVNQCQDWKLLAKILQVLQSGKEGHFPELSQAVEKRMLSSMPPDVHGKYLAIHRNVSPTEVLDAELDLRNWEKAAKQTDCKLALGEKSASADVVDINLAELLNKTQYQKILDAALTCNRQSMSDLMREKRADNERRKGNEYFKTAEWDEAIRCYTKSIALVSKNELTWNNRALSYIKKENYDLAENDCNVAVQINPHSVKALTRRGLARLSQGKYKLAALDFNDVLNLGHDTRELRKLLQQALDKYQDSEGFELNVTKNSAANIPDHDHCLRQPICFVSSMSHLFLPVEEFLPLSSGKLSLELQQNYVKISIEENDEDDDEDEEDDHANSEFRRSDEIKANTRTDESRLRTGRALEFELLGNSLVDAKKYAEAIEAYDSSIETMITVSCLHQRAKTLFILKDYERARADCSQILVENPNFLPALCLRSRCHLVQNNFDDANADVERILACDPSSVEGLKLSFDIKFAQSSDTANLIAASEELKQQGNNEMALGHFDLAKDFYSRAISLNPNNWAALSNRTLANLKLACYEDAKNDASELLHNDSLEESLRLKTLFRRAEALYNIASSAPPDLATSLLLSAKSDLDNLHSMNNANSNSKELYRLVLLAQDDLERVDTGEKVNNEVLSPLGKQKVLDLPKSYYEFERQWRSLERFPERQIKYLSLFKKSTFRKIFGDSVDHDTVGSVFQVACKCSATLCRKLLDGIIELPSMRFFVSLLSGDQLDDLKTIYQKVVSNSRKDDCVQYEQIFDCV